MLTAIENFAKNLVVDDEFLKDVDIHNNDGDVIAVAPAVVWVN